VRSRLINRRRQGDLGEASAIEWLARQGATVLIPFGHSPDYDLVAELGGQLTRVQVKTSTFRTHTPNGHERWSVSLVTNGGNQSWSGVAKRLDQTKVDAVFVLVGDGRRWCIPASVMEASSSLNLGGPKYAEFEIATTEPIERLVYAGDSPTLESDAPPGEYRSGQTGCAVNALAMPSQVRILPPPSNAPLRFQRTRISSTHQVTIPSVPFRAAALEVGDRLHASADGEGRVILERIDPSPTLDLR
jgi:PD-(D/E)XK endonuclease